MACVTDAIQGLTPLAIGFRPFGAGGRSRFPRQRGYGAFSVGAADSKALINYMDAQEEHQRTGSFQEGYRAFLAAHGVECDERNVWDCTMLAMNRAVGPRAWRADAYLGRCPRLV